MTTTVGALLTSPAAVTGQQTRSECVVENDPPLPDGTVMGPSAVITWGPPEASSETPGDLWQITVTVTRYRPTGAGLGPIGKGTAGESLPLAARAKLPDGSSYVVRYEADASFGDKGPSAGLGEADLFGPEESYLASIYAINAARPEDPHLDGAHLCKILLALHEALAGASASGSAAS